MIARLRRGLLALVVLAVTMGSAGVWSEELWLEGRLLVARDTLDDPNVRQTVVYVMRHSEEGAAGVIVNRRLATGPLVRLLESLGREAPAAEERTIDVYDGGPVARQLALLLHGDDYASEQTVDLELGLRMTPFEPAIDDIADGKGPAASLLLLGHAGWAPGQLEQEIAQGAWAVVEAEPDFVLDPAVGDKWRRALAREGRAL
jgi:putative transcriptional regulator